MSQTVARCAAAMPLDLLSAWHDREVAPDVAQRMRQHVATCQACQTYLAAYEADGRAIRDFAPPPLQDAIWRDVQPVTTQSSSHRSAPPRGVILGGLGAAMAVVLFFATISVIYLNNHGHSLTVVPTGTPAATAINTIAPTATVATLKVSPSQGWVNTPVLSFGKAIAFSQSEPLTGYVCGNLQAIGTTEQPILLSATHDGGLTWLTPHATPAIFSNCDITINPNNAQDIVLHGADTWGPYDGTTAELGLYYRSLNGGNTWMKLMLPTGDPHINGLVITGIAWAGTTLFASAKYSEQQDIGLPPHQLAKSVNNGSLQWADQSLPLSSVQVVNGNIGNMFELGSTFYVSLNGYSCPINVSCTIAATNDDGTIWTTFKYPTNIQEPVNVGGDGMTLLSDSPSHPFLSTDQGHTWKALPAYPQYGDALQKSGLMMAPDGTIYIELDYSAPINYSGLYKLSPNATTWIQVVQMRSEIVAASYDTKGHAVAVWRINSTNDFNPGIQYHAP